MNIENFEELYKKYFPIKFVIDIDQKFPFKYPKVYTISTFCEPTLADGRDLLEDLLGDSWTP